MNTAADLAGWTPIRVDWRGTDPVVDWCFTDGVEFADPFFDQTIERCFADPFRLLFRHETSVAALAAVAAAHPEPPAGFVLHASRCGSTLVAQMFAGLGSTAVRSEPGPLDSILRAPPGVAPADQADWFRWMVAAVAARRAAEDRVVVKLDAWATRSLPVIERAYPGVAKVFVYRDPVEVLVSHIGHRGFHMVPGALPADLLGLTDDEVLGSAPEDFLGAVLARLLEPVVAADVLLVDYRELPEAVIDRIAPHFGIDVDAGDRRTMLDIARRNAKNTVLPFTADSADKQRRATETLRAAANRWCRRLYDALEARRAGALVGP